MNYYNLRKKIEKLFENEGIDDFADIDWIAVEILGKPRSMLPFLTEISVEDEDKIMKAVELRLKHIPIAYIFGKTNFFGYDFEVNHNVLIPRIDTEVLIEKVVSDIKAENRPISVLDIGTGSGVIAVTIQKETGAKVYAVDISQKALEIAKRNAKSNNADVEFFESNVFEKISNLKVDFIVSNPPYIETETVKELDKEVVDNEPILALDGGKDGLDFYRRIVAEAQQHLNENGRIYFEIGYNQAEAVSKLLEKDFEEIEVLKDYSGNDRVVFGKLRG